MGYTISYTLGRPRWRRRHGRTRRNGRTIVQNFHTSSRRDSSKPKSLERARQSINSISTIIEVTTHGKETNRNQIKTKEFLHENVKESDENAKDGDKEEVTTTVSEPPKNDQADQRERYPHRLIKAMAEIEVTLTLVEILNKSSI